MGGWGVRIRMIRKDDEVDKDGEKECQELIVKNYSGNVVGRARITLGLRIAHASLTFTSKPPRTSPGMNASVSCVMAPFIKVIFRFSLGLV